jgi:hypothetical protein
MVYCHCFNLKYSLHLYIPQKPFLHRFPMDQHVVWPEVEVHLTNYMFGPLGHVSYCHHFSSVVCHPSVNISHFNLLLRNHWANCNQTLAEWSLDGPLPKLCPEIPTSNQDGRQAQNRKRRDEILIVHCCFSVSQNELKF